LTNHSMKKLREAPRPAGYSLLQRRHNLNCLPHHVESFVARQGMRRTSSVAHKTEEIYPKGYWPGEGDFDHLEFALKHEGLHLQLLRALLPCYASDDVAAYVREKPTSGYARRVWFLYEEITGRKLKLPDVPQGNYVDLINAQEYYTGPAVRSPRHRVNMNLLGSVAFSPMVRRTKALKTAEGKHLDERCRKIIKGISPEIYERALQFFYTKETKSSYAIERETPDQKRAQKFAAALREAAQRDYLSKENLVALQKTVVDPRFANEGWRDAIKEQNYVGRSLSPNEEEVHFVAPKPEDLPELMSAFLESSRRLLNSSAPPVVAAAAIAYPFVFLHPFSDGNGRLHRFLIHYVLSHLGFAPDSVIFPVSATMLHRPRDYDATLEVFSKPLLSLVEYKLDSHGKMTVLNETCDFYRYIDCTFIAEMLFSFVEETIEKELPAEIQFLQQYDAARNLMRGVVDLPNRGADLFVRLCLQNRGRLARKKRNLPAFAPLSDKEISSLEAAVAEAFGLQT
jgi:hypothetical protein